MTTQEAIEILRDTPIDIRSTREDDIHTLYATAQGMAIEALSAQPERKTGRWIFPFGDKKYKRCSVCGRTYYSIPHNSNFCPNCGADMRTE